MEKYKFYNETFNVNFELVLFKHDNGKECKKVNKYLTDRLLDYSDSVDGIDTCEGFCILFPSKNLISIIMDVGRFSKDKEGSIKAIKVLAHECNHFRQGVLDGIAETITKTDLEAHLRISDWAFRKCMSTKFFKSLLK
jgi:hypothetical protein